MKKLNKLEKHNYLVNGTILDEIGRYRAQNCSFSYTKTK